MVDTVCIVGIGLIGGSLASGLREQQWCSTIIGIDNDQTAIDEAKSMQIIDEGYTSISACPNAAEVVVVAVPVLKVKSIFEQLKPWMSECKAITDVGSTKQSVIDDFNAVYSEEVLTCFVPGHPIAGREQNGVAAAIGDLFVGKKVILTPIQKTNQESTRIVSEMWQSVGANVEQLEAHEHDTILAATSHLPHALAYALVHCLSTQSHTPEIFRYAAGGFADFTRIASSDPIIWRDICLANKDELLQSIAHFDTSLQQLRASLSKEDGKALQQIFIDAKNARDRYTNT